MRTRNVIIQEINELNIKLKQLYKELSNTVAIASQAKQESYQKRKALLNQSAVLFVKRIQPGDIITVIGSRASKYRRVISIDSNSVTAYEMKYSSRTKSFLSLNQIISCSPNKINALLVRGKWITAREIVDNEICTPPPL